VAQLAKHPIGDKIIAGWSHDDHVKNFINVNEEKDGTDENGQHRPDDVPAQSFQMINKAHLRFFFSTSPKTPNE
jgi:hypothetical protein